MPRFARVPPAPPRRVWAGLRRTLTLALTLALTLTLTLTLSQVLLVQPRWQRA